MRSSFDLITEECRRDIHDLNDIILYFIGRSANMAAHQLARASYMYPYRVFNGRSLN